VLRKAGAVEIAKLDKADTTGALTVVMGSEASEPAL
jgi:hypothetical protein